MRKHFLILMLLTLLPLAGWAQLGVGKYFPVGNFYFQVVTEAVPNGDAGTVELAGVRNGKNPVDANKKLVLVGHVETEVFDDTYQFDVIGVQANALKYNYTSNGDVLTSGTEFAGKTTATTVVIPKEYKTIVANTFVGYTNMTSISFEEGSEVTTIASGAFTTTQISSFDFSNCAKLTTIQPGLFVEPGYTNSYITSVKLPLNSEALTSIGTAFQNLPNLTEIQNLDQSKITTVAAEAFLGDAKLDSIALPSTVQTIAANAFQGSAIEKLVIDVTSLNDITAGNVYGTSHDKLKKLYLKGELTQTFKSQAFEGCENLATLTMTDMTINGGTIGASAFKDCVALTSLTFNDITGESTIGANAFKDCTALTSVVFGNITGTDVKSVLIGESAFDGCEKIEELTFGNLLYVTIDNKAFSGCGTAAASEETALEFGTLGAVVIEGGLTTTGAFYGCTNLNSIKFGPSEGLVIEGLDIKDFAFEGCATGKAAILTFGNINTIIIGENAFDGCTKIETLTFGNFEGVLGSTIKANAFKNCTGLKTLTFGNLKNVTIEANAFNAATSALDGTNYATAIFGNLEGTTIQNGAFAGATRLNTVTIGDVTTDSKIGTGANVFPALKTATIGYVKGGNATIAANSFKFGDYSEATLNLASATGKYLQYTGGGETLISTGAFDFTVVENAGADAEFVFPVINIGEIKTADALAVGALKGSFIKVINFKGDIVANGLNNMIIKDNAGVVAALTLNTLNFYGTIAATGIAANAFAGLPVAMTITFNGKLAAGAVVAGAFEGLMADSHVSYLYNGADIVKDASPFAKRVFDNTTDITAAGDDIAAIDIILDRDINLTIANADLKAKFFEETPTAGLVTNGAFDIYRVIGVEAAPPAVDDFSFYVYTHSKSSAKQAANPSVAWARWELGARQAEGSANLPAGTNLVIKRVQEVDGTHKAKITIYGTYTDEDDALNASTIYMMPLKVTNGYYHIPGTNKTTLIVKVENNGADFEGDTCKVKVNQAAWGVVYDAGKNSIWTGLVNNELFVASQIMTNQQLVDKSATDPANAGGGVAYGYYHNDRNADAVDIYRGTDAIAEDLYIMSDPSKNKGFRIDKTDITGTNNAYINTGWYYMLLKKYDGGSAAANVIWLDDFNMGDNNDFTTAIQEVKNHSKNNAVKGNDVIYNLAGQKVGADYKGIVIKNGKKFVIK